MPTLTRNDGTQFVTHAYRASLTDVKKTSLRKQVCKIAEQQGSFVRLFKKETGQHTAVFSREPGYLLGESIKHYFHQTQNLIFCEAMPNSADVLVVVVRAGNVYLDALIATENLHSKLTPLITEHDSFQVITSGDVPLKESITAHGFCLPTELVISFEILEDSLFPRLPTLKSLQLLPMPLALKAEQLTTRRIPFITLAVIMVCGIISWWALTLSQQASPQSHIHSVADPYRAYNQALSTPAPEKQLNELVAVIQTLYTISGWQPTRIVYHNAQYDINVTSNNGSLETLNAWAKENHFGYELTAQAAILTKQSALTSRPAPTSIYQHQHVLDLLIDQLDILLLGKHIRLQQTTAHGLLKETTVTITLQDVSSPLLIIIGQTIKDLPLTMNKISLTITPDAINGTINLSVWGK